MDKDGVELLAFFEVSLATIVSLSACPTGIYLFYSEDYVFFNLIVSSYQRLMPFQISAEFALMIILSFVQVTVCVAYIWIVPQCIFMVAYVTSVSFWISGLTKRW